MKKEETERRRQGERREAEKKRGRKGGGSRSTDLHATSFREWLHVHQEDETLASKWHTLNHAD